MKLIERFIFVSILLALFFTSFLFALTEDEKILFDAVYSGNAKNIAEILSSTNDIDVNAKDGDGYTPLHRAIFYNKLDSINALLTNENINLEEKLPYNTKIDNWYIGGATPLMLASYLGYDHIVDLLLKKGADIRARDEVDGSMSIHIASANGRLNVIRTLLNYDDTIINENDNKGNSPLHWASMKDKTDTVKLLIENGADVEAVDKDWWTPLHYAAAFATFDTIKTLVGFGANVNDKTSDGHLPLFYARRQNIVNYLKDVMSGRIVVSNSTPVLDDNTDSFQNSMIDDNSEDITIEDASNDNLHLKHIELMLAVKDGDIISINNILSGGLDPNFTDLEGYSPLHRSVYYNKRNSVEALLNYKDIDKEIKLPEGSEINRWYLNGATPLLLASYFGYTDIVNMLLDSGADINARDESDGAGAIHIASANGNNETIMALLYRDKGMIDLKDETKTTPLEWATMKGKINTVSLLLSQGADIKLQDKDGFTALHYAVSYGNTDIIRTILDFDYSTVDMKNYEGLSALQIAAKDDNLEAIRIIVKEGHANIDEVDSKGLTALHYAAANGNFNSVKDLVDLGADKYVKDSYNGLTAEDLAKENGYFDIAKFLKDEKSLTSDEKLLTSDEESLTSGDIAKKMPMPSYKRSDLSKKWWNIL